MSYLYANRVNDRILCGNLPHLKLEKGTHEFGFTLDLDGLAKPGLQSIKDSFIPLYRSLQESAHSFEALDKHIPSSINLLINTGLNPEFADIRIQSVRQTILLSPYITTLDKALWYCIINLTMLVELTEHDTIKNQLYAWLYIFKTVQANELLYRKTLDLSMLSDTVPLFDILCNTWKECDAPWFVDLTTEEGNALDKLFLDRKEARNNVLKDFILANEVAEQTEKEWCQFLDIINDLSIWEYHVISRINNPTITKIEKLKSISVYNSICLHAIACDHYYIKPNLLPLSPILEAVQKRMQLAQAYCICSTFGSRSFRLREEIIPLLKNPKTFNYLFISYHQFRMDPTQENAMRFSGLALSSLKRNLGYEDNTDHTSIDDIAKEFLLLVNDYTREYSNVIAELKFSKLQQDSIIMGGNSLDEILFEQINDSIINALGTVSEGINSKDPEAFLVELQNPTKWQQHLNYNGDPMQLIQNEASKVLARQIVVSLNIIYLFCDALRLMLKSRSGQIILLDKIAIDSYRNDLIQKQKDIANAVYIDVNIDKDRENRGIEAKSLTEQETEEDQNRNYAFMEIYNDFQEDLLENIKNQSIDGLFAINKKYRDEILQFPICSSKEQCAQKFDETIAKICSALVDSMRADSGNFEKTKQSILLKLGDAASILPPSSLDTLSTAELLYQQYALPQFVQAGFDYSCISSLYYQAFEDAYNQLIWYKYAADLNIKTFGPRSYPEILFEHRRKTFDTQDFAGYLSPDPETRRGYIEINKFQKRAYVRTTCMYKLFATIMKEIKSDSEIKQFCKYFAKLAGYKNSYAMLNDPSFMANVGIFAKAVDSSVCNRNNASHGGSPVPIDQCQKDKHTVLSELEAVRENSIGLIQQLLNLLKNSKTLPMYNH